MPLKYKHINLPILLALFCILLPGYVAAVERENVWLVTEFDENPLYEGMSMEYTVKLLMNAEAYVQNYEPLTELVIDGCEVVSSPNVPEQPVTEFLPDGRECVSVVLDRLYIHPESAGTFYVPGISYRIHLLEPVLVNHPYWGRQLEYMPADLELKSEDLTFNVNSLPEDIPQEYTGVMGDFRLDVKFGKNTIAKDKLYTIAFVISGVGNISEVELPAFSADDCSLACDVSEPFRDCREQKAGNNMMGVVRFEYTIVPRQQGTLDIKSPVLVFFNTQTGAFHRIGGETFRVEVVAN